MSRSKILFLVGVALGAAGMFGVMSSRPQVWSYAFSQTINGEISLAVKPNGEIEFGPAFSADKSLQALLDGLKDTRRQETCGPIKEAVMR